MTDRYYSETSEGKRSPLLRPSQGRRFDKSGVGEEIENSASSKSSSYWRKKRKTLLVFQIKQGE